MHSVCFKQQSHRARFFSAGAQLRVGLPGFPFIRDPLDYGTIAHHSAADTYSHAVPEDLMQAAAVIASLVSDFANQEQRFPRKP